MTWFEVSHSDLTAWHARAGSDGYPSRGHGERQRSPQSFRDRDGGEAARSRRGRPPGDVGPAAWQRVEVVLGRASSGKADWCEASTASEAIRRATLLAPRKPPAWLSEVAADAERQIMTAARGQVSDEEREPTSRVDAAN
jgi:hypothetical protein